MNEEKFVAWWESTSIQQYNEYQDNPHECALAAWSEATRIERERCAGLCGNQFDFLKEAILRGGK